MLKKKKKSKPHAASAADTFAEARQRAVAAALAEQGQGQPTAKESGYLDAGDLVNDDVTPAYAPDEGRQFASEAQVKECSARADALLNSAEARLRAISTAIRQRWTQGYTMSSIDEGGVGISDDEINLVLNEVQNVYNIAYFRELSLYFGIPAEVVDASVKDALASIIRSSTHVAIIRQTGASQTGASQKSGQPKAAAAYSRSLSND
jgi:hypothetical protein